MGGSIWGSFSGMREHSEIPERRKFNSGKAEILKSTSATGKGQESMGPEFSKILEGSIEGKTKPECKFPCAFSAELLEGGMREYFS
jgi:hypothetical protein